MTLSPVFRSQEAVQLLADRGVWSRLAGDLEAQAEAVRTLYADLEEVLGEDFRSEPPHIPSASEVTTPAGLQFLQEYFFLILFRSIFATLGVSEERLRVYTELNFCIKGTITAADNIFDDQAKTLLPLAENSGSRFMSILQLMAFERLLRRVLDRGEASRVLTGSQRDAIQRGLLDRMAAIGTLEGSEEGGVDDIPPPGEMVDSVHRVRGGALFALAFGAPAVLEGGEPQEAVRLFTEILDDDGISPGDRHAALTNRGMAYIEMGSLKQGLEDLDRAIDLNPEGVEALINRAAAHAQLEQGEQALADLNRVLELDPENYTAHYNRGNLRAAGGTLGLAVADYSEAVRLKPDFHEAFLRMGTA